MNNISTEMERLISELELKDDDGCIKRLNWGQLRHICRYFYNLGKLEAKQ